MRSWVGVLLAGTVGMGASAAPERLVLVGGGTRPPAAMERFVSWAGGHEARILVVAWASGAPEKAFEALRTSFAAYSPAGVEAAPAAASMPGRRREFLAQLARATGVFFSGGKQGRVMDVLKDEEVLAALRARYHAGAVFGGTSAGTAIMSTTMLTGSGDMGTIAASAVETREGLGLLSTAAVDQHFLRRRRANRLFSLLLRTHEAVGLGIDESTAIAVDGQRYAEVLGTGQVMAIDTRRAEGAFTVVLVQPGQVYDIVERRTLSER